ncbi:hypothetical protein MAR_025010 [Mya arenaria]|uniref:Uncharacterized protein n=1 Tax=Mya arenaria TaxID=6604 RepID=A0ABY7DVD6_MYAAR|nr:hypothetical protein MAR_025010 [Mya arenaria]
MNLFMVNSGFEKREDNGRTGYVALLPNPTKDILSNNKSYILNLDLTIFQHLEAKHSKKYRRCIVCYCSRCNIITYMTWEELLPCDFR